MKFSSSIKCFILSCFAVNFLYSGCGGCEINNEVDVNKKSSAFIDYLPSDGMIEGFVIASCNKCNLGIKKDRRCSMGIKVADQVYSVKGHQDDHSSAHDNDGICKALRIAYVSGKIKKDKFYADYFSLMTSP